MAKETSAASSSVPRPEAAPQPATGAAAPVYVCVGHVTRDLVPSGWTFGGTAFFAGLAAVRLGCTVRCATRLRRPDADLLRERHPQIDWRAAGGHATTTFRNVYGPDGRVQHMPERATRIRSADVALATAGPCIVHLAPVTGEIGPSVLSALPSGALIGLTAQGLVRGVNSRGHVVWRPWRRRRELLDGVDILVLSDEDIRDDPQTGLSYLRQARVGILTRGPRSIHVFERGVLREVPVRRVAERHVTGAGDVFTTALLVELYASGALGRAIDFAAAAGALWVERSQLLAFPTRDEVERRQRDRK